MEPIYVAVITLLLIIIVSALWFFGSRYLEQRRERKRNVDRAVVEMALKIDPFQFSEKQRNGIQDELDANK
ncbi:MAG: hypothetical protein ACN4GM_17075 [Gammaproteobacteria bacterium]